MTDRTVVVLAVAILVGALTYGGLVGIHGAVVGEGPDLAGGGEVSVQGTTYHLDRAGRPTVVGEVSNTRAGPVTNVTVTVTFLRDGEVVGTATGTTLRETIPAGGTAPFDIHLPEEAAVDDYRVSVSATPGSEPVGGLVVVEASVARRSQDQVTVSGTIRNTAGRPLTFARLVATFYNRSGSVIGARTVRPARTLAPGEHLEVRVTFRTLGDIPSLARQFERFDLDPVARTPAES